MRLSLRSDPQFNLARTSLVNRFLHAASLCLLLLFAAKVGQAQSVIYTIAGSGQENVAGTTANPGFTSGIALDAAGNVYLAVSDSSVVLQLGASTGKLSVFAGTGVAGYSGDSGSATNAQLNGPLGIAVDSSGNLYIADSENNRVRKVSNGVITTVAGNGMAQHSGDNGPATSAGINAPLSVTLDSSGNLYILETCVGCEGNYIREVSTGMISTIAGACPPCTTPSVPADAVSIAADPSGDLFLAFPNDHRVLEISNGVETTIAGQGGNPGFGGDGGPASSALLHEPMGVAVDSAGNLYIADEGNNRVRVISGGIINTVAGSATIGSGGDGGQATNAQLMSPAAVGVGASGTFYIVDSGNQRIREVSAGVISSIVSGTPLPSDGDNIAATTATLALSPSVAVDTSGNIYIAETGTHRIRKVSGGTITTVAGNGTQGYSGDLGVATSAQLNGPLGLTVTASGDLYIADTGNSVVRKVSNGIITTVAGNGMQGYSGDNGPATSARLKFPAGVAVDASGNLFIADTGNWAVRKVSAGTITTYLGNVCCFGLNSPAGLALDSSGNLYVADSANQRIVQVAPNGNPTIIAGVCCGRGYNGDNIAAATAELNYPVGVAVDASGNIYIADALNQRVRKVTSGVITTVAGNGTAGDSGDNGSPASAQLTWPSGIAVDASGNLYIADMGNSRVREVGAPPLNVSPSPTTLTISAPGGSANATITVAPAAGFSGTVTLSCAVSFGGQGTATDPPTCQLGATQLTITSPNSGSTTLTVSTTPGQQAGASYRPRDDWKWPTGGFALLIVFLLVPLVRRGGRRTRLLLAMTVIGSLALLPSCGGGGSSGGGGGLVGGTTTGNYTVTTTATSGGYSTTTSVPLVVQ
jgi:sugar lactone lactonase YvrE